MQRRTSSVVLCVTGAGLMAFGNSAITEIFLVSLGLICAGLFGLWHSEENSCLSHVLAYTRQEARKRFPLVG